LNGRNLLANDRRESESREVNATTPMMMTSTKTDPNKATILVDHLFVSNQIQEMISL
jgi:hypothetical protein